MFCVQVHLRLRVVDGDDGVCGGWWDFSSAEESSVSVKLDDEYDSPDDVFVVTCGWWSCTGRPELPDSLGSSVAHAVSLSRRTRMSPSGPVQSMCALLSILCKVLLVVAACFLSVFTR